MFLALYLARAIILKPELTRRKETVVATNEETKLTFYREESWGYVFIKKSTMN